MTDTQVFRYSVILFLAAIFLVLGVGLGVRIYHLAHPTNIKVWCDWDSTADHGNGAYNTNYEGPADQLLGACQVRR